jgi:hypothetical protein
MFDTENVPVRVANITHRQMEKDEAEIALVEIQCEINPLTPTLAGELDDYVRGTLFTRTDVEVNSKLKGAAFTLPIRPQEIVVRMAPDQKKDTFTIREAKIASIKATRSKKSSAWTLTFTIVCSPTSNDQLGQIVDCYLKTRYITTANATADLFDEADNAKRARRSADATATESAAVN